MPAPNQPIQGSREVWALLECLADKDGVKARLKDLQDGVDSIVEAREAAQKKLNELNGIVLKKQDEANRLSANLSAKAESEADAIRKAAQDDTAAMRKDLEARERECGRKEVALSAREARIATSEHDLSQERERLRAAQAETAASKATLDAKLEAINKAAAA